MKAKPVVGQVVFRKKGGYVQAMNVISVGRKYFEVKDIDEPAWYLAVRVLISDWMTARDRDNYQVYESPQGIDEEAEEAALCRKIGDSFKGDYSCGNRKDLPLEAIRRIAAIIDAEAGKK